MSTLQNLFFGTTTVCLCSYFTAGNAIKRQRSETLASRWFVSRAKICASVEGAVTRPAVLTATCHHIICCLSYIQAGIFSSTVQCAAVQSWTDPFDILPKSLTVAGPKDLKLHVGIGAFSTEVHQSGQAADSPLKRQESGTSGTREDRRLP